MKLPLPMTIRTSLLAGAIMLGFAACSQYSETGGSAESQDQFLEQRAAATIDQFRQADLRLKSFFEHAHGYVVFPDVAKGGLGVGGAHGYGVVYQKGQIVGYSELTQGSLGAQIGGQTYSEIVFLEDEAAMAVFQRGDAQFAGNASAVGGTSGAATGADYDHGVAVFVRPRGGLMLEAAIGGQSFSFRKK